MRPSIGLVKCRPKYRLFFKPILLFSSLFPCTASTQRLRANAVVAQGGRENAARECEHEKAIGEIGKQKATPAIFGEGGMNAQATTYKGLALLAEDDCSVIRWQREDVATAGVPILCILGDTRYYAVFDRDSRSTPGGYGHVKHDIAEHGNGRQEEYGG